MLEIREFNDEQRTAWDDFVNGSDHGTIFHTWKWLQLLEENQQLKKVCLGFFDSGELIGILPLFQKRYGFITVAASPFVVENTPYMGLIIEPGFYHDALSEFEKFRKYDFVRMLEYFIYDPVAPKGYKVIDKHTHILDLKRSETEIWTGFEGRCRTAIRKAEKNGVSVSRVTDREFLADYYSMLEELYARQKMPNPVVLKFFLDLWDGFHDNLLLLKACVNGECVAGAIVAHYKNRAYYLNGVSRYQYNHLAPNNSVQWAVIRLMKEIGIEYYDFVGSDIERLANFKKSFGGELATYRCLEKSRNRFVTFLRENYTGFKMQMGNIMVKFKSSN